MSKDNNTITHQNLVFDVFLDTLFNKPSDTPPKADMVQFKIPKYPDNSEDNIGDEPPLFIGS